MGYFIITEVQLDDIIRFAQNHTDYQFHCETVGFDGDVLACIFNREQDDDSVIFELDKER